MHNKSASTENTNAFVELIAYLQVIYAPVWGQQSIADMNSENKVNGKGNWSSEQRRRRAEFADLSFRIVL